MLLRNSQQKKLIPLEKGNNSIILGFGVSEDVRFEVGRLSKFLIASIKWADIRPIARMDAYVRPKIEIQGKSLPTSFKGALERFFACMDQLMSFQFGRFNKGFPTFSTNMDTGTMSMQMLSHGWIVSEHLGAALMGTGNCSNWIFPTSFFLGLHSKNDKYFYLVK